jgi:hypothetical protein
MSRVAIPILATVATGLALYASRGVLDQVLIGDRAIRVALVPPWQALVGFIGLAFLGLLALARWAGPRRLALAPVTLPLIALGVLLVPFLPGLADQIPALQVLAGPFRWLVWLAVLGLVGWTMWQHSRTTTAAAWSSLQARSAMVLVALSTAAVSGLAATRLTETVLFPAGDEPHYLVIAQSVWRDRDLKIENNHTRGDYREYYPRDLEPHFLTRGVDGEIYSIHPVGLAFLIAPLYGIGGYRLVVGFLIVLASIAAAITWRTAVRFTGSASAAWFAWASVAVTTPLLFNTFSVYPEIAAALAVVVAFTRSVDEERWPRGTGRWLAVGLSCATLPWLSTKYAPMSAALVLIALGRIWYSGSRSTTSMLAVLAPYGASLLAWFTFFYVIWGSPFPQAPYGDLVQTHPLNLIFGAPGLLFDQEYGLLPYAPVYVLAATGLIAMYRAGGEHARRAAEIMVAFAALLATVGAFRIWWGGSASPGRPLASGLFLLAFPIAMAFHAAAPGSARRAAQHVLLWISVGVAGTMLFAQDGFLIANGRDGTSSLLEYLSPRWELWTLAPTFIHHEAPTALVQSAVWLVLGAVAAIALRRWRTETPGAAALAAICTLGIALATATAIMPLLPLEPALPHVDLRARARLPLLDGFDARARPVGIRYDPIRLVSPVDVQHDATLDVTPGSRRDPQPIRVIHNGRFSLPAGRYRLQVQWSDVPAGPSTLAIQVGRTGNPWRSWLVSPSPGGSWHTEFTLPVDANFVGFRGTVDLERAIARLSVAPLTVLDAARRPNLPPVLGATEIGTVAIFFHDENCYPEVKGFWVRGQREARVSLQPVTPSDSLMIRVHGGPRPNRVTVSMSGWQQTLELLPDKPQVVQIPAEGRPVITLGIRSESGFRPPELDPSSQDLRHLGVWVEFPESSQLPVASASPDVARDEKF